jgi:hypothetical protein
MKFIDFLIEGTTYISILIFVAQFTRYSWQQTTTNRTPVLSTEQLEPAATAQPKPKIMDAVVSFRRPVREYSDLALIRLAKHLARQGRYSKSALKWSFNRKLSKPVRSELLKFEQQVV